MATKDPSENCGRGQSGYAAGRRDFDPALDREVETRNRPFPRSHDEDHLTHELGTDERWSGRGGEAAPGPDREPESEADAERPPAGSSVIPGGSQSP